MSQGCKVHGLSFQQTCSECQKTVPKVGSLMGDSKDMFGLLNDHDAVCKERDVFKESYQAKSDAYNLCHEAAEQFKKERDELKEQLQYMTEKFERNSIAAGEYSLEVERLKGELETEKVWHQHWIAANDEINSLRAKLKEQGE